MKLTIEKKREIVVRFKAGETISKLALDKILFYRFRGGYADRYPAVCIVLRDYMNGKFRLRANE